MSVSIKKIILACRAFLSKPKILLIDENALDIKGQNKSFYFKMIFKRLMESTVMVVMNNFENLKMIDYIVVMDKGKVIEEG